jgi:hypothetical protein
VRLRRFRLIRFGHFLKWLINTAAAPGLRHTIKCQACKFWSHSDCVGNLNNDFICALCKLSARESSTPFPDDPATLSGIVGEEAPISQRTEASFIHGNAFEFSPDPFLCKSPGLPPSVERLLMRLRL